MSLWQWWENKKYTLRYHWYNLCQWWKHIKNKSCHGNCEMYTIPNWKPIMNKAYRKNYNQRTMNLCTGCLIELLDGTWSGGGPFGSDVKRIVKKKRRKKHENWDSKGEKKS